MPFNIKPLRPAPTTAPAQPAKAAALYHAENQIHSNMPQIGMQKVTFHLVKDHILQCKRTPFILQAICRPRLTKRHFYGLHTKGMNEKKRETVVNVPSAGQQHRKNKHQAYGIIIFIRNFAPSKQRRGHAPKHKVKDYGETI